jgi:hypothetical protein
MHARQTLLGLLPAALLAATAAQAQTVDRQNRPPEVLVVVKDEAPRCEPQQLRVPSRANIDLRITNQGKRSVLVSAPDMFKDDRVRGVTNAKEANGGYVIEHGQTAQFIVLTPEEGEYKFGCVEPGQAAAETTGSLVTVRSATQYNK